MSENPTLISMRDACALTSLSRGAIDGLRSAGMFPAPVLVGTRRRAFVRAEVEQWIADRIAERARQSVAA